MKKKLVTITVIAVILILLIGLFTYISGTDIKGQALDLPTIGQKCWQDVTVDASGSLLSCSSVDDCTSFALENGAEEDELDDFRCESSICEFQVEC